MKISKPEDVLQPQDYSKEYPTMVHESAAIERMQEYAREIAMNFADYLSQNYSYPLSHERYRRIGTEKTYTIEQIYDAWIESFKEENK